MATGTQVRLANDIAAQFAHLPQEAAVTAIAGHLRTFWDPRMREQLLVRIEQDSDGVDPLVVRAVGLLR